RPKRIWRFPEERGATPSEAQSRKEVTGAVAGNEGSVGDGHSLQQSRRYPPLQIARAWMPFAIFSVLVLCWGLPSIKTAMGKATTPAFVEGGWNVPYLHKAVLRAEPVVEKPMAENAKFEFNWLTATGTACFLAALLAGTLLGLGPADMLKIFGRTLHRIRFAACAMACMLALGHVTR